MDCHDSALQNLAMTKYFPLDSAFLHEANSKIVDEFLGNSVKSKLEASDNDRTSSPSMRAKPTHSLKSRHRLNLRLKIIIQRNKRVASIIRALLCASRNIARLCRII